jgi:glycosyltransferase involved in cell wall biosynthesis
MNLKEKVNSGMKITIITVCFNAAKTIERTFQSILNQTNSDFEYLIIDGKSQDGTMSIIKSWESRFIEKGIYFKVYSEKDSGLYDAMNKGAAKAKGRWIIYMNADDEFSDENAIQYAEDNLVDYVDILYGNTIIVDGKTEIVQTALPIETIKKHLPFIPQSAFIKTELQKRYAFNLNYKITADYDCFLRMYIDGCQYKQIDYCFSKFHMGGVSNKNEWKTYKEDIDVKHANRVLNKYAPLQIVKYVRRYLLEKLK